MPEGATPCVLDPASNPQPSITVGKTWAGIRPRSTWVPTLPGLRPAPLHAPPGHVSLGTEQFLPPKSSGQAQ